MFEGDILHSSKFVTKGISAGAYIVCSPGKRSGPGSSSFKKESSIHNISFVI